jgi:tetratricopeptide (TPR) repeat protein
LNNPKEANSSLEKALKEVGSEDSRLIKDKLRWYDAYSDLLTAKSDLLSYKGDLREALRVLEEKEELLEYYKDKLSEKKYYEIKSTIMGKLGKLMFATAESENDLKRAQEYVKNLIICTIKADNRQGVTGVRVNLATIQMMLAKNQDDFKKANEKVERINLEDCVKIFEEARDKRREAFAKGNVAIYCLALKNDKDAIKFAEDSIEIVKNGPSDYAKAEYELTLAYIKMTSRLSDFKKGELSDEVHELIRDAYEKFEKRRVTSQFVARAVEVVAKYLQNKINYDELLKELDELAKELEIKGGAGIRSWL